MWRRPGGRRKRVCWMLSGHDFARSQCGDAQVGVGSGGVPPAGNGKIWSLNVATPRWASEGRLPLRSSGPPGRGLNVATPRWASEGRDTRGSPWISLRLNVATPRWASEASCPPPMASGLSPSQCGDAQVGVGRQHEDELLPDAVMSQCGDAQVGVGRST